MKPKLLSAFKNRLDQLRIAIGHWCLRDTSPNWAKGLPAPLLESVFTHESVMHQSPIATAVMMGSDFRFVFTNEAYTRFVNRQVLGKTVAEAFTEEEVGHFIPHLKRTFETGEAYIGEEVPITFLSAGVQSKTIYVTFGYHALRGADQTVQGVLTVVQDVTQQVEARRIIERANTVIEDERINFRNLFEQAPELVCICRGPEHIFEFVNEAHIRTLGFDATGMSVREAQPESIEVHGILDDVFRTGKTFVRKEVAVTIGERTLYFNLTYAAWRDSLGVIDGIMILASDVTSEVELRKAISTRENHLRSLVDDSPATMWMTDTESKCVYLSRQWYLTTGRTPEQDLGFGWVENVHPDDREKASKTFFTAINARGRLSIRYRLRHKSGEYRWAVDSGLPRFADDGKFLGYIGTVIDIHDQISSEGELRELQSRFDKAAIATNLGVWYCDLPFGDLIWNAETKEHFFLQPHEHVTINTFYDRIHPDDRDQTRKAIEHAIATHTTYDTRFRTTNKDESEHRWVRAIGWTDYKDDKPIRFDGITLDISNEVRREQELEAAKEEAERANQLKSAFLANMSHEIRTPLGAMIGFAELLRDPGLTAPQRSNYIDILARNGEGLSVIINDILDLSKVEAGHLTLEYTDARCEQIAEDVVSLLRVKAKEKDLALDYRFEASAPRVITSDPMRIRQILMNLVGNAIKFTPFGSVSIRGYGCINNEGRAAICFEIVDTGIGIPASQKERVFEMFVQADGSTTRRFGGTGLGLALSRSLARSLGGDVCITHSEEGKGTTFLVTIEDRPERRNSEPISAENKKPLPDLRARSLDGVKVLVVDDAPDNRQLIWHYLNKQGAVIESAENGLLGVRMALAGDYDVILMDIQMPEMDGYTATYKLRSAGYRKPIIALTAHAMNEVRDKVLRVGATSHLPKPINFKELIATIAEQVKS